MGLRRLRWGLTGALVAWTAIRLLGLERGWPLVPLLAFTPYVAVLGLLGAGVAAWRRWFAGAAVAGACALVLAALVAPRAVPGEGAEADGVRLRVLAANVAGNAASFREVLADVRRWDVDVFSVVELSPRVVRAYDAGGIRSLLPSRALEPRPGFSGTGLYARLPLRPQPGPRGTRFAMAAAEARPSGAAPVELVSVHVQGPTAPGSTDDWKRDMRALPGAGAPGPVRLLIGDFNATLDHAELRRLLDRGYRDAAEQAGTGLRPTWPEGLGLPPSLVTIDHVLADRRARVVSARSVPIFGSDHRGVLAEIALPGGDRPGG